MHFGHAELLNGSDHHQELNETVWQAREGSSKYFAILPSADGHATAFFCVQSMPLIGDVAPEEERPVQLSGTPPVMPTAQNVESANVSPNDGLVDESHWFAVAWFGLTLGLSGFAICRWVARRDAPERTDSSMFDTLSERRQQIFDTLSETPRLLFDAPRLYMPVMGSEQEAAENTPVIAPRADSDDDVGPACPKAPFSSLKVFGMAIAKRLSAARSGVNVGRRPYVDTDGEDSDGYDYPRSPHRGDAQSCEESRGLLSCESHDDAEEGQARTRGRKGRPQSPISSNRDREAPKSPLDNLRTPGDREAMNALMKLRPAARDSVGDDTLEDSDGPLIGTNRSSMLSR
jgi:hypothetical protein